MSITAKKFDTLARLIEASADDPSFYEWLEANSWKVDRSTFASFKNMLDMYMPMFKLFDRFVDENNRPGRKVPIVFVNQGDINTLIQARRILKGLELPISMMKVTAADDRSAHQIDMSDPEQNMDFQSDTMPNQLRLAVNTLEAELTGPSSIGMEPDDIDEAQSALSTLKRIIDRIETKLAGEMARRGEKPPSK